MYEHIVNEVINEAEYDFFEPDEELAKKLEKLPEGSVMIYNETSKEYNIVKNELEPGVVNYFNEIVSAEIQNREMNFIGGAVNKADDIDRAVDVVKYTPPLNQSLSVMASMGSGYGYGFNAPSGTVARKNFDKGLWKDWAKNIELTSVTWNTIHSLLAFGVVWIEKQYDHRGGLKGEKGWGVSGLRVLSPKSMFNVVDRAGNVIFYAQVKRTKSGGTLKSATITIDAFREEVIGNQLEVAYYDRHRIVFMNYNAFYDNSVYGTGLAFSSMPSIFTKLGVQRKILRAIDTVVSPFVLIKYGTDKITPSAKASTEHFNTLKKTTVPKFVKSQGFISSEKVELGEHVDKIESYLNHFTEEEKDAVFSIPALRGGSTSSEGATIQLEVMQKMLMFVQNKISEKFKSEIFIDAYYGNPLNTSESVPVQTWQEVKAYYEKEQNRGSTGSIASLYPDITLKKYRNLPSLRWNPMENNNERRLRYSVLLRNGGFGIDEIREESGYDEATDYQPVPVIAMKIQKQDNDISIKNRDMDLKEAQLELDKRRLEFDMEQARKQAEREQESSDDNSDNNTQSSNNE